MASGERAVSRDRRAGRRAGAAAVGLAEEAATGAPTGPNAARGTGTAVKGSVSRCGDRGALRPERIGAD